LENTKKFKKVIQVTLNFKSNLIIHFEKAKKTKKLLDTMLFFLKKSNQVISLC